MAVHRPNDLPMPAKNSDDAVNLQIELGKKLTELRIHHNMSLMSLAQATRININFLQAMENGRFVKDLPGEVFARGFVKNICKALGEDPKELLAMFDLIFVKESEVVVSHLEETRRKLYIPRFQFDFSRFKVQLSTTMKKRIVWSLSGCALAALVVFWIVPLVNQTSADLAAKKRQKPAASVEAVGEKVAVTKGAPSGTDKLEGDAHLPVHEAEASTELKAQVQADNGDTLPGAASEQTDAMAAGRDEQADAAAATKETASLTPVTGEKGVLALTVKEPVRLRIGLDGKQPEYKKLEPQDMVVSFEKRADLLIFDAAAVEITFNGRPLGSLGKKGRVRRISFDLDQM